jgi:hypothetical protein
MGMETACRRWALSDFVLFAPQLEDHPRVAAVSTAMLEAGHKSEVAAATAPSGGH